MLHLETFDLTENYRNCAHSPALPNENIPKNTGPLEMKICCDSRGDGCCYLQELNWKTEHYDLSFKLCLYPFTLNGQKK